MPARQFDTKYPVIDNDPHFNTVVKSFRPSDVAIIGASTMAYPAAIRWLEWINPTKSVHLPFAYKGAALLGAFGGFLLAYQNTSLRYWGWRENHREVKMEKERLKHRLTKGLPVFEQSTLPETVQNVAARHSRFSAMAFSMLPWFNFVHHHFDRQEGILKA